MLVSSAFTFCYEWATNTGNVVLAVVKKCFLSSTSQHLIFSVMFKLFFTEVSSLFDVSLL